MSWGCFMKWSKETEKTFNLRAEKTRRWARNVGLKKTAGRGLQGPLYWIELGDKTILKSMSFPADNFDTMDHPEFWEAIVESDIAPFYGITDPKTIQELKNVPYAMSRGRVANMSSSTKRKDRFVVYYGEKMTNAQQKQVIEDFNLSEPFRAGLVTFEPDEHEVQNPEDQRRFSELLA